jgi:methylated-DNA-[protein]-cysteine S-methyltransferase
MTMLHTTVGSPIGELLLIGDGHALHGLYMQEGGRPKRVDPTWQQADESFGQARTELAEYFAGERREFDVPLAPTGTDFNKRVWAELRKIPYGETITYGEQARRLGIPSAARAVGSANGLNPLAVVVPCHRVVGAGGKLTGYAGGLERKRLLLELESGVSVLL